MSFLKITSFILFISGFHALHAQTFQKIYRVNPGITHQFRKMVRISQDEFAFITTKHFYRIDQQGNVLAERNWDEAGLYLEHLSRFTNGDFCITGSLYGTNNIIRLYRISPSGQITLQKDIHVVNNFDQLKLVAGSSDHQYLSFSHREPTGNHADLYYFDGQFNTVWKKEFTFDLGGELDAVEGENNGVELLHNSGGVSKTVHLKVDTDGDYTVQPVNYQPAANTTGILRRMIKTHDSGYLYAGYEKEGTRNNDILLVKTGRDGNTEWEKRLDLYLGDIDEDISVTDQGYILLARTGLTPQDQDQVGANISLMKMDPVGNPLWVRSFGTAGTDYGKSLLVNLDGSILFGGQATTYYSVSSEPVLFRTDQNGLMQQSGFPLPLVNPSPVITINPDPGKKIQRLVNGIVHSDDGTIMAALEMDPVTEKFQSRITRTNQQGAVLWHKELPYTPFENILMKALSGGHFISVAQAKGGLFGNVFKVSKTDADGNFLWVSEVFSTAIRDIIPAPDGGFLLCGMENAGLGSETRKLILLKLNSTGQQEWKQEHSIHGKYIVGRSLAITPQNDILVAGYEMPMQTPYASLFLAKFNAQGILSWYNTFPYGQNQAIATKLIVTADNSYLITGYIRYFADLNKQDILLLKTDQHGVRQWEKQFDFDKFDAASALLETAGHYFLAGTSGLPELGPRESFGFLMKTDPDGNQKGAAFFGNKGTELTCTDLQSINNKLVFLGTIQQSLGVERPFRAELTADIVLSAPFIEINKKVKLFPVPASRRVNLQIDNAYTGIVRISITGISGIVLLHSTITKSLPFQQFPLDISGLPTGTYLVEAVMGKEKISRKLVIAKP
ncbi:MAG: T9SS type A sorting domain-containing protein [Pseudobacter sp.]|uniref:T9SS type A sorting domain-containing protein n=1 Tax=Pseudobacter sp. TaxID=2045420 RepID=UPI003F81BF9C